MQDSKLEQALSAPIAKLIALGRQQPSQVRTAPDAAAALYVLTAHSTFCVQAGTPSTGKQSSPAPAAAAAVDRHPQQETAQARPGSAEQPQHKHLQRTPSLKLVRSQPLAPHAVVDLTTSKHASDAEEASPDCAGRRHSIKPAAPSAHTIQPDRLADQQQQQQQQQQQTPAGKGRQRQSSEQQDIRHLLRPLAPSPSAAAANTPPLAPLDVNGPLHQDRKRTLEGHPKGENCAAEVWCSRHCQAVGAGSCSASAAVTLHSGLNVQPSLQALAS